MLRLIPRRPAGHIRSSSLAKARTAPAVVENALLFPANVSGSSTASAYGVIEFANPEDNGLPIQGPGGAGITVIRRIKPIQQTGYYAQFWYVPVLAGAPINGEAYWGFHPYPQNQSNTGTTHYWEIANRGGDTTTAVGGSPITVTQSQWYVQACRVAGDGVITFWPNLPSQSNANTIQTSSGSLGSAQSDYKLVIGNSPWMASFQEERASMHLGPIKIFAKALSEADIVSEGNSMTTLATSEGQSTIWWGKTGFGTINDLTCDYGTGRSFTRNDSSNIITLGEAL